MTKMKALVVFYSLEGHTKMEMCIRDSICTIKEIQSLSQRLQVAKLLNQNKTYNEIENLTGASTATICRINKCLGYGADGYKLILDKMKEQ